MMKIIFAFLCFAYLNSFSQDYQKKSKDDLIQLLTQKDDELKGLKKNISQMEQSRTMQASTSQNCSNALAEAQKQIQELKTIIKNNNDVSLRGVFESKYTPEYFEETDLDQEDKLIKFKNSITLINSVKVDASQQTLELATKAMNFNVNYIELFEIRENVLKNKFDENRVVAALKRIENLPAISASSKLSKTKDRLTSLLKNYKEATCDLKGILDALKPKMDQKALLPTYVKVENAPKFKGYPYLVSVISKMKKDVISYTPDALQPCEAVKKPVEENKSKDAQNDKVKTNQD